MSLRTQALISRRLAGRSVAPTNGHGHTRQTVSSPPSTGRNPCASCAAGLPCPNGGMGPTCEATSPAGLPGEIKLASRGQTVESQGCLVIPDAEIVCEDIDLCGYPQILLHCESLTTFTASSFNGRVFTFDPDGSPCPDFIPRSDGCPPCKGAPIRAVDSPFSSTPGAVIFVANSAGKYLRWNGTTAEWVEVDATLKQFCRDFRPVVIGNASEIFTDAGGQAQFLVPRRCSRDTFLDPAASTEETDKTSQWCVPSI